MKTEKFEFEGAAGDRLSGRFELPAGAPRGYALFAHCFTCGKDSLAAVRTSRELARNGIGVLRFDFGGLGGSEGDFSRRTFGDRIADIAAAAHAMEAAGRTPLLLIGHSLGGAAALAAGGSLPNVRAICTIGAPFDIRHLQRLFENGAEVAGRDGALEFVTTNGPFRLERAFLEDLGLHDQSARIANLQRDLLVLHAPADEIVGVENAMAIFEAAQHPKSIVALVGADHLLTKPDDCRYAATIIAAWASPFLAPAPDP